MAKCDAIDRARPADKYEAFPEAERCIGAGRFGTVKKVRRVSDGKVCGRDRRVAVIVPWQCLLFHRIDATSFPFCTN